MAEAVIKSGAPLLIVMVLRLFSSQAPGESFEDLGFGLWAPPLLRGSTPLFPAESR